MSFHRSQSCTGSVLPPYKVGHLNSKIFLSEVSKKEKNVKKILEGKLKLSGSVTVGGSRLFSNWILDSRINQ